MHAGNHEYRSSARSNRCSRWHRACDNSSINSALLRIHPLHFSELLKEKEFRIHSHLPRSHTLRYFYLLFSEDPIQVAFLNFLVHRRLQNPLKERFFDDHRMRRRPEQKPLGRRENGPFRWAEVAFIHFFSLILSVLRRRDWRWCRIESQA